MSSTSVWSGACVPNPFENSPPNLKRRGVPAARAAGSWGQSWPPTMPALSEWFTGSGWASVLNTQSSRDSMSSSENRR